LVDKRLTRPVYEMSGVAVGAEVGVVLGDGVWTGVGGKVDDGVG